MRYVGALAVVGSLAAGVWVVSQPPSPATTGELQFPRQSTPYTCSAGREGRVYYDLDVDTPYYCDDTNWVTFGTTISGTNPYVPRFNSAGTNIENSDNMQNAGTPAAGAGGAIFNVANTLNAMDGSDTVTAFQVNLTNADHTGSSNFLRGVNVAAITGDAQANESAYRVGTGWDNALDISGTMTIAGGHQQAATGSHTLLQIVGTITAMSSGAYEMIDFAFNGANHTGGTLIGINLSGIGGGADADASEYALVIGASAGANAWDQDIRFTTTGALGTHSNFFNENTNGHWVWDTTDVDPNYIFGAGGTAQVVFQGSKEVTHLMGTDLAVVGSNQTVDPNANSVEISAGAAASVSIITAPTTTNHTEQVTFICVDANVTFNDADAAGAAGTINLAGAATNFTCSGDDTLTVRYVVAPAAGNARWVEVSRSVN